MKKVKFAIIGAGSVSFCPATVGDILLNEAFMALDEIEIYLMDIKQRALDVSKAYCDKLVKALNRNVTVNASLDLQAAVDGADFVIVAIEVERYHYWSQDFHIPRRYGFRQVYGENGGPGGMFHALRNLHPIIEIARAMEKGCPDAWLLNYTNPEAKLVEGISRLSKIKSVGLCHGEQMGLHQLSCLLQKPMDEIGISPVGLNHFGWYTRVWDKKTNEDLYPRLREAVKKVDILHMWDEFALQHVMFRTYGVWPYAGTNHIGEYIAWSDSFLASTHAQFYFDPAAWNPWDVKGDARKTEEPFPAPPFIYSFAYEYSSGEFFPDKSKTVYDSDSDYAEKFNIDPGEVKASGEYGLAIAEAVYFDKPAEIGAVNVPNRGYAPYLPEAMVIELPAMADGTGLHPKQCDVLPDAVIGMLNTQGMINKLIIDAYTEKSRNKLLQAILLDPTVSTYHNSVALINEMFERQKDLLPEMYW